MEKKSALNKNKTQTFVLVNFTTPVTHWLLLLSNDKLKNIYRLKF